MLRICLAALLGLLTLADEKSHVYSIPNFQIFPPKYFFTFLWNSNFSVENIISCPLLFWEENEAVLLWVNKVGPFNNPMETYPYYKSHIPFCNRASELQVAHNEFHYERWEGLGSLLEGNNLVHSGIPIKFKRNQEKSTICTMKLDQSKMQYLIDGIKQSYWFSATLK